MGSNNLGLFAGNLLLLWGDKFYFPLSRIIFTRENLYIVLISRICKTKEKLIWKPLRFNNYYNNAGKIALSLCIKEVNIWRRQDLRVIRDA